MQKAFNDGLIESVEGRNARNTTATRFEDFAAQAPSRRPTGRSKARGADPLLRRKVPQQYMAEDR